MACRFMNHPRIALLALLVPVVMAAACSDSTSPTQASSVDGSVQAPEQPTVSSTTPRPTSPTAGVTVPFVSQPVRLVVTNAVSTAPDAPTYTFQVSTDPAFGSLVANLTSVAAGDGQTAVTLNRLAGSTTYYWRALIVAAGEPGPISAASNFTVGPEVVIQAPVLVSPAGGSTVSDTPTLTVANAARTGPAGELQYRFEIADNAAFSATVYSVVVPERPGGTTSHVVTKELEEKTYYWRALAASPAAEVVGPFSTTGAFRVQKGIDLRAATIVIGPSSVANWEETARITSAYFDPAQEQLCIFHTRLGLWPKTLFASDGTTVEGNQWVFANINGRWIGGAADYYRPGQACKGLNAESIGRDAFYQTPNSPAYSWQPKSGEIFAVMASTPARAWPTFKTYDERSNIVFIRWP